MTQYGILWLGFDIRIVRYVNAIPGYDSLTSQYDILLLG